MTVGTFPGDVLGLGLNETSNYSPTGIWDFSGADYISFGDSVNVDGKIVYASDDDVYISFGSNRIQFYTRNDLKIDIQGYSIVIAEMLEFANDIIGTDAFSGTATADTVTHNNFWASGLCWVNASGASISANDVISYEAKEDTIIFHRPANGTADLPYNWWRAK